MTEIPKPTTANSEYIIGNNWPAENATDFTAMSVKHSGKSAEASGNSATAHEGAAVVNNEMDGLTSDAATKKLQTKGANLETNSTNHGNKAVTAGIAATTIHNAKGNITAIVTSFETYATSLAENPLLGNQEKTSGEFDRKRDEARDNVTGIFTKYTSAMDTLKSDFKNGSSPSVPADAPSAPPGDAVDQDGNAIPGMDTSSMDPTVTSALSQLGGQAMSGLNSLTQGGSGQGTIDQLAQQSPELLKTLMGQDGVPMSEEAFDKMMENQDSGGKGDDGAQLLSDKSDDSKPDEDKSERKPEDLPPPKPDGAPPGMNAQNVAHSPNGNPSENAPAAPQAPSPAETPKSAPPPSATVPSTTLTSDDNAPSSTSPSGTAPVGNHIPTPSTPSSTVSSDGAPSAQAPSSANTGGTELSSSTATASPATSLSGVGAAVASPVASAAAAAPSAVMSGMSGVPTAAGTPVGMGAPVGAGFAPTPTAAPPVAPVATGTAVATPTAPAPTGAPATTPLSGTAPAAPQSPFATPAAAHAATAGAPVIRTDAAPMIAGVPPMAGAAIIGAPAGSLHHPAESYTPSERVAGTYLAGVYKGFYIAKDAGNVAVALLPDGTAVFNTVHGCGYMPRGAVVPANTKPLLELPEVSSLFVSDWTGCDRPGYVLRLAAQLGIIPEPRAIVALGTSPEDGVTVLSRESLKGTPVMERTLTRSDFGGVAESDMGEVFSILDGEWGNHITYAKSRTDLITVTWDVNEPLGDSVSALARYMLADAHESYQRGDVEDAAYCLLRAIRLPSPDEL